MTSAASPCDGKLRYHRHSQAARRIGKSAAQRGQRVYHCEVCGGYHISAQMLGPRKRRQVPA